MHMLVWIFTRESKTRTKCCALTAACAIVWEAPGHCHYHFDLSHSPSIEITSLTQGAMVTGCTHTWPCNRQQHSNKNQANKTPNIQSKCIIHSKTNLSRLFKVERRNFFPFPLIPVLLLYASYASYASCLGIKTDGILKIFSQYAAHTSQTASFTWQCRKKQQHGLQHGCAQERDTVPLDVQGRC